jgi:hypothetical protein
LRAAADGVRSLLERLQARGEIDPGRRKMRPSSATPDPEGEAATMAYGNSCDRVGTELDPGACAGFHEHFCALQAQLNGCFDQLPTQLRGMFGVALLHEIRSGTQPPDLRQIEIYRLPRHGIVEAPEQPADPSLDLRAVEQDA